MAADITLLALPATVHNWHAVAIRTHQVCLPGDDVWRDEDGDVIAVSSGAERRRWDRTFEDSGYDWLEVGAVSYLKAGLLDDTSYLPAPTVAVGAFWDTPRLVTPVAITETMVLMNRPDRSHYRHWRRARRQHVKRWLADHTGWIVWTETW